MTKVKLRETKVVETEAEIEYPIYLYFQDELCRDELIMINEKHQITIKYSNMALEIRKEKSYGIPEHYLKSLTTKEHFDEVFNGALDSIVKYV